MTMTHVYPTGAIQDEEGLLFALLGQTLFFVHGLGANSFMTRLDDVSNLHTDDIGRLFEYQSSFGKNRVYLNDCNIGSHYNDHYIFSKYTDAERYLEYAKLYTSSRSGPKTRLYVERG